MSIVQKVTLNDFWHWLVQDPDSSYYKAFSYHGAGALFSYFENLSEEMEEPISYDPIAWCVEFSEYATLHKFNEDYNSDVKFESWDEVAENTTVIKFGNGSAVVGEF